MLATTVLSALGGSAGAFGADLGVEHGPRRARRSCSTPPCSSWCSGSAPSSAIAIRDVVPGAITAAIFWQLLQLFGTAYVGNVVKGAGATYGVFALVLGLLAWIFLAAVGVVISAEINVVRTRHLYPRALMTPFTDNVDLTAADRRAYTDAATAQRFKGFQSVTVRYADEGQQASASRRRRAEARDPIADSPDDDETERQ